MAHLQVHINVQVCTSLRVVKYLYKYIHKGLDKAAALLGLVGIDETVPTAAEDWSEWVECLPGSIEAKPLELDMDH